MRLMTLMEVMKMKQFLNKRVKLGVKLSGVRLSYTGTITEVSETHISFTDKFGTNMMFNISCVIDIQEIRGDCGS